MGLIISDRIMWDPVTITWRVLGLRMEETASKFGGYLRM